jgi:hypothetical protein
MKQVDFVEQDDGPAPRTRGFFSAYPQSLPETGQGSLWAVCSGVDGRIAVPLGHFEQQRRLAYLARPGQELNSAGCRLVEAPREEPLCLAKAKAEVLRRHTRIIIRV